MAALPQHHLGAAEWFVQKLGDAVCSWHIVYFKVIGVEGKEQTQKIFCLTRRFHGTILYYIMAQPDDLP